MQFMFFVQSIWFTQSMHFPESTCLTSDLQLEKSTFGAFLETVDCDCFLQSELTLFSLSRTHAQAT